MGLFLVAATMCVIGTVARTGEYHSVLTLARTAVDRWPTSPLHHLLGVELIAAGDREEGMRQLRLASPGAPTARLALGRELFNEGKLDEAIHQLEVLIDIWSMPPTDHPHWQAPVRSDIVSARLLMGQALAKRQAWEQAIEQYRLALSMAPSSVGAIKLLGDAYFGSQMFSEAAAQYEEYLKSVPNDTRALTTLGIALVRSDRLHQAVQVFRRVVDLDERNSDARRNLAAALLDTGDGAGAARQAREALVLRPNDPALHDLLGRALLLEGSLEEARVHFERALEIDPSYPQARDEIKRISSSLRLRATRQLR